MFNKFRKMGIEKRLEDQILFEYVLEELEEGVKIKGLWAKAYANSEGDSNKVEPLYMQYRVQSIKDIFTAMELAYEELSKAKIAQLIKNNERKFVEPDEQKTKQKEKLDGNEKTFVEPEWWKNHNF